MAQGAVVDIQDPGPGDGALVDVELVAVVQVVVDHRRQEVVGGGDRVEVAGQVQIHALGGQNSSAPGSPCTALDPEGGSHGGLTQGERGALAPAGQGLDQADGRGGFALPEGRGSHAGDHDVMTGLSPPADVPHGIHVDFGDVATIWDDVLCRDAGPSSEVVEVGGGLGAVPVGFAHGPSVGAGGAVSAPPRAAGMQTFRGGRR